SVPAAANTVLAGRVRSSGSGTISASARNVVELGTTVETIGGQVVFGDAVILTGAAVVTSGAVNFSGAVDGNQGLTLNNTGLAQLSGAVGATTPLANVAVAGMVAVNGGLVATQAAAGDQTYNGPVVLGANTVLSGNDVTFNGTLDADATPRTLTVN